MKDMRKICLVGSYNETELLRGPDKVARRVADALAALGHRVCFFEYFSSGERYGYWSKLFGNECVKNSGSFSVFRVGVFPFMFALLSNRFDVIHIITFERFAVLVLLLKPFIKASVAYTVHGIVLHQHRNLGSHAKWNLVMKDHAAEFLFLKFADLLFFLSDRSVSLASQYYRISKGKVVIVANGIDELFYEIGKREEKERTDIEIVFVGDPGRPEKGLEFFLHALERCTRRAAVFVICENPPPVPVNTVNGMKIRYLQKMDTPHYAQFLKGGDIYVSASSYEPFSIAAVEAMCAGLVPVVTKETGMSRYVQHDVSGFVIGFGDMPQLAETLDLLIADGALRNKLSLNARSAVAQLHWRSVAEEYLRRYALQ